MDTAERAWAEGVFEDARRLSAAPDGQGVTRLGYSRQERAVMDCLAARAEGLGLACSFDGAGNLWMRLESGRPAEPCVVAGSHADSVPGGGNYDGLAGIVAALCAARRLKSLGVALRRDYCAVALRSEEVGLVGSSAMLGRFNRALEASAVDAEGRSLGERMTASGVDLARVSGGVPLVDPASVAAWLELHIEQGPRLVSDPVVRTGLVSGICGIICHACVPCRGEAGHAGAVGFAWRHDAAAAVCELASRARALWKARLARGEDMVFTMGLVRTPEAPAFNKIPGLAEFSLDVRSLDAAVLEGFYADFRELARAIEGEFGVSFGFGEPFRSRPAVSDPALLAALEAAAAEAGVAVCRMPSGAGHDAQSFTAAGIPSAMLFVANANGSHNPREAMAMEDFGRGADVLAGAVRRLAAA
ncbi:MAG: hydantoinase/carbamoylase family amidase [Duodenibacillus sp.]|nr:hydantoinase/carbamoylase family amidase [Duodenibacillus sp.]